MQKSAFTLVELLIVISIIGILTAIVIPAVQSSREAARRIQCSNNIRNLTLGIQQYAAAQNAFPSGGWGFRWVGDPDLGLTAKQSGSWIYSTLPYLEEQKTFQLGKDGEQSSITAKQKAGALQASQTILSLLNCPSRRGSQLYFRDYSKQGSHAENSDSFVGMTVCKTDYAANAGEVAIPWGGGPESMPLGIIQARGAILNSTGIISKFSQLPTASIRDGLAYTFMLGEKFQAPDYYESPLGNRNDPDHYDPGDNESAMNGDDYDNCRTAELYSTFYPARFDAVNDDIWGSFGSAHPVGFNASMCDGTVKFFNYEIDEKTYRSLFNRKDGNSDLNKSNF
jgi:prepilin-type N-terminal cleavage/methylation domain-containing protein